MTSGSHEDNGGPATEETAVGTQNEPSAPPASHVELTINGADVAVTVDNRSSLLDTLRESLDLTGTKKGCDHGQCGACTVLLDGRRVNSCLVLAVTLDGTSVVTVEGLATEGATHPVQQAFLDEDALQCGYCTPGQICSAIGAIDEAAKGWPSHVSGPLRQTGPRTMTDDEIRERMSGNLCRCGAYTNIVAAVRSAASTLPDGRADVRSPEVAR